MSRFALALITVLLCTMPAAAAPVKISVAEFKVTGAAGKDDLKGALQSMLASRLAGENLQVVGANDAPDMTVIGTYIVFGKVFSLDGQLVGADGKTIGRAFEQGDAADDVIPAIGRLAQKLTGVIGKTTGAPPEATKIPASSPSPAVPVAELPVAVVPADIVRPVPVEVSKKEAEIIRPERTAKSGDSGMTGQRIDGVMIGMVQVRRIDKGSRDLVVALEKELRFYHQEKDLNLLDAEKGFGEAEKIISIDCADLDADGIQELYVTALNGEQLASRVYLLENGKFKKIAKELPYFFRSNSAKGKGRKIYAQEMGVNENFYGSLYEVVKKASSFTIGNPLKLPRFANIYNVNQLPGKDGKNLFIMIHPDGYLTVYDEKGENLWKSSDRYGGSELAFSREDIQNMSITGSRYRKQFIEQRITVTESGEIIVPKNEGSFVVGDSRSYNKNSVYAFVWNGAALEELWHTRVSQNYLSDYSYDSEHKELVILEVVKKAGIMEKGATAVVVKRVE